MRRLAALLGLAAALTVAAPAHAGRWTDPQVLGPPDIAFGPEVDMNARGDAIVAWTTEERTWVALALRGRDFSTPVALTGAPGHGGSVRVSIDERRNAAVGWTYDDRTFVAEPELREDDCCVRLAAAVKPAGRSTFGRARTVSRANTQVIDAQVAAGPGGGGFLWTTSDIGFPEIVVAAFGGAGGLVRGSHTLGRAGDDYYEGVSLVMRRDGSASIVAGVSAGVIRERVRRRSGAFGRWRTIVRDDGLRFAARWADAAGREFMTGTYDHRGYRWSTRAPGGRFSRFRSFPRRGGGAIDVAPDGRVLSVSTVGGFNSRPSVYASARRPGRSFSTPRRVAGAVGDRHDFVNTTAALGNRGRGMAVWDVSPDELGPLKVFARPVRGGVPTGSTRQLQLNPGDPAYSPSAAASASGLTTVVWVEKGRIVAARYVP
ncbi:MAG: hypothetical protein M3340_01350 [Actinomycetota bacterium]|nr:hypothetical protein [Actinomycetota bacterium]